MSYLKFRKKSYSVGAVAGLAAVLSVVVISACTDQAKASKPRIVFKDKNPSDPNVVAKIGDRKFTKEELIGEDKSEFFELEKREFELTLDRVKKVAIEEIFGPKAKAAGMSLEDYIGKKVVGEIKISDKEYQKFIAEKHIPEAQIKPEIKERIYAYLQGMKRQEIIDAALAKETKSNPIEVFRKKPKMVVNVDVGSAPVFGKSDAPVTIVEFSDFECPFCSRAADTVNQVKKKYGNKVRIAFRHFPLPMHKNAKPAAEASMCINDQNGDKFWKFHDLVFKNQDKLDKANLDKYAKDVGADMKKYSACVDGKKFADFVQKEMEYGEKIGVKSTPTFYVNGQVVSGAVPIESFSEIVDEELEEKKAK